MSRVNWERIEQQLKVWREVILPGIVIICLVSVVRFAGLLQFPEWTAFDYFLRLRPYELADTRVVIVGINEDDIKNAGSYPIPDDKIAKMLRTLQAYHPRVIGLDLFKDVTGSPGRAELSQVFRDTPNIIGIEKDLNPRRLLNIKPPPELPPERIGFVDFKLDPDGKLRRSILASRTWEGQLKYSLPLRLAQTYLKAEGIALQHGPLSTAPIRFGSIQLNRFLSNFGGYVRADDNGNQMLVNFRHSHQLFRTISLTDILADKVNPKWIEDRIAIVGMTASSIGETFITSAVNKTLFSAAIDDNDTESYNQLIYGVEVQAHVTSQILSAVLDGRHCLRVWFYVWDYLWILAWGLSGIALGLCLQSPWKTLSSVGVASILLSAICYLALALHWWIPFVPTELALVGAGLTTAFFDRDLRFLLKQRSQAFEQMFEAIHNGPLQEIAVLLRTAGEEDIPPEQLQLQLRTIDRQLRDVYHSMKQEMLDPGECLRLEGNLSLNLAIPIDELLYQIYDLTLRRKFQCYLSIRTYIRPDFKILRNCHLSATQKRGLCLFLQEALCNVGKHAADVTCLDINCTQDRGWYSLQIIDNGIGIASSELSKGRGTIQAQELARHLRGKFRRLPNSPRGTICELTWPVARTWFDRFSKLRFWKLEISSRYEKFNRLRSKF